MLRPGVPSKPHVACGGVFYGDPESRVEGRCGDAASKILNDRLVVVHPKSRCAA
jgi:hypothetical protein